MGRLIHEWGDMDRIVCWPLFIRDGLLKMKRKREDGEGESIKRLDER